MRLLLNLIWLVLAGFWMFLGYLLAAALWCLTIVGIPFGVASYRIGRYALWPFGREVVLKPGAGVGSALGNVLWFVFSGLWLAIGHAITGVLCCLTVIGIPLGLASFKLIPVSLLPLGREIVDSDDLRYAVASYGRRTGV
ncbi:YccF domain-containing protein [Pimelobacter simplex]|uniref:YccF domain-containing protein n=1 Tax=Nocardioides simplex TaxID=2045 RepID=UPI003AAE05BC